MKLLELELKDLHQIEDLIISISNKTLLPYLNQTTADVKKDGSIVTEADLVMQSAIHQALQLSYNPQITLLGEESDLTVQQEIIANNDQYWVLDPLDGTTNFHNNFPIFCISLAFIQNNEVKLGVIYDPIRKECFSALKGFGFFYNQTKVSITQANTPKLSDCIAFVDFKRINKQKGRELIENTPFKSQRNIGSSALEWAWLAINRANLTFHGGQKLWDYAAGSLLLSEAGGYSQDSEGGAVFQNNMDERPIIAASSKALCQQWALALNG
ncbi:MAG: inositol monophosphatase [Gammaproteobacteria bacterium]|nr:inositol monophosphatase [Gammaproteobacteria bacterium]